MPGLTPQDRDILRAYAKAGNRELYWNYLAQMEGADGYGLLALGVVRNDSMPGAVANHFAANRARADGHAPNERDWERFGEDLVRRDLALRSQHLDDGRPDLALNLPVADVQRAHDASFNQFGIDPNAWTPRQLLEAARRQGGEQAAGQVWANMLDNRGLGLGRMGITSWDVAVRYNDAQLPATRYLGALTGASALAAVDRARVDPDIIGARDFYHQYDRRTGQWSSVATGGGFMPQVRAVTDPRRIAELDDARAVRLESQVQRGDFHPDDPNRHRPIARSPFTLADADAARETHQAFAAARDPSRTPSPTELSPEAPAHPLYRQALAAIALRDAELGRTEDDASRRIAAAGAALAARSGYTRIDDIVFNVATERMAGGERFFVLQGARDDPAQCRVWMPTRDALATPQEQSQRELAQADAERATQMEPASQRTVAARLA